MQEEGSPGVTVMKEKKSGSRPEWICCRSSFITQISALLISTEPRFRRSGVRIDPSPGRGQ